MAVTIAGITAAYCLVLCALASLVTEKVRTHQRLARWMERAAGVFLIGFGLKLSSS
jgi:threonine/homoserine/homoserine lactone efflux protein